MERNGRLRLDLFDAYGDALNERIDIFLYHQTLSETVAARNVLASKPIVVGNLLSVPQGLYRLFIDPPSYLPVSVFVNIASGRETERALPFAIDPDKVLRIDFPEYPAIDYAHRLLESSRNVLGASGMAGETLYNSLDNIRRAGMLNILAKTRHTPLAGTGTVLDMVTELREVRGDRFFASVSRELREHVRNGVVAGLFREVSGGLHRPPDGFNPAGSYKSMERYGNLQITFFASGDSWVADMDIDDAAGLEHVFQVSRNAITGLPTHPYNIHDILLRHQEIDPGYRLIVHDKPLSRTAAGGRKA